MNDRKENKRGMTYRATYTGSHVRTDESGRPSAISLFFMTPDGAQRTLYTSVGTDERSIRGLGALKSALGALGQKDSILPIAVDPGAECAVVLDGFNPGFVRYVNPWRTGNAEVSSDGAAAVNALLEEVAF